MFKESGMLASLLGLALAAMPSAAIQFTFAGETWEQDSTPDVLGLLGNSQTLGGASFSPNLPTTITQSVGFIATSGSSGSGFVAAAGYDANRSIGKQATAQHGLLQSDNTASIFTSAVNLPAGNAGSTVRHGLQVSWSGGRTLTNAGGDDFVVYESGSNATSPEGFMARARRVDGSFSDWYFTIASMFQIYTNTPATVEGAFAHVFDLSDLGIAPGGKIDAIQIANLVTADRIDVVGAFATSGRVVFSDPGGNLARPATNANGNATFASGALDPDPLYVGIFNALDPPAPVPAASSAAIAALCLILGGGLAAFVWMRRRSIAV